MLVFHVHCQDLRCLMVPVGFMRFSFYFNVLFIHSTLPTNYIVNVAFMYILLTCFTKKFESFYAILCSDTAENSMFSMMGAKP